jgi:hypothetical protein
MTDRRSSGTNISITGSPGAAIASGAGARASGSSVREKAGAATIERIGRLLADLEQAVAALPSPQAREALHDIRQTQAEMSRPRPSMEIIRLTLDRLAVTVGSVAGLLAKVEQVKELITPLIH